MSISPRTDGIDPVSFNVSHPHVWGWIRAGLYFERHRGCCFGRTGLAALPPAVDWDAMFSGARDVVGCARHRYSSNPDATLSPEIDYVALPLAGALFVDDWVRRVPVTVDSRLHVVDGRKRLRLAAEFDFNNLIPIQIQAARAVDVPIADLSSDCAVIADRIEAAAWELSEHQPVGLRADALQRENLWSLARRARARAALSDLGWDISTSSRGSSGKLTSHSGWLHYELSMDAAVGQVVSIVFDAKREGTGSSLIRILIALYPDIRWSTNAQGADGRAFFDAMRKMHPEHDWGLGFGLHAAERAAGLRLGGLDHP